MPIPIKRRLPFYWWITGTDPETGKRYLDGPHYTEKEAHDAGFAKFNGLYEPYCLPTCDESKAKAMLKSKLLEQSGNISDSMKPISYM